VRAAIDDGRAGTLRLLGLMGMAPLSEPHEQADSARRAFDALAELAGTLPGRAFVSGRPQLSMGMSGDLEQAVAAGADVVRVGSAFFEGLPRRDAANHGTPGGAR
jgi:uncharacterized pyridoxal phosphate-containing UPF0001 family protein